jgi:hypothetical protein
MTMDSSRGRDVHLWLHDVQLRNDCAESAGASASPCFRVDQSGPPPHAKEEVRTTMDNLHQTGLGSLVHREKETFHDDMVPRESSAMTRPPREPFENSSLLRAMHPMMLIVSCARKRDRQDELLRGTRKSTRRPRHVTQSIRKKTPTED